MFRKAVVLALIGATLAVVAQHVIPRLLDDFAIVHQGDKCLKVFKHGWPVRYSSGPAEPSTCSGVAIAVTTNFIVASCVLVGVFIIGHAVLRKYLA